MEKQEFSQMRRVLGRTQRELADLLGTSLKAVHSYEQGWRNIPMHVERQLLFMVTQRRGAPVIEKPCWIQLKCPAERKRQCPAWEFNAGKLCWLINGTLCSETRHQNWREKMKMCRDCVVLAPLQNILHEAAATL